MITVTKQEHNSMVSSGEETLIVRAVEAMCELKRGADIGVVSRQLLVAHANLSALENYETGRYDPAEYFNVVSPDDVTVIYSNINQ